MRDSTRNVDKKKKLYCLRFTYVINESYGILLNSITLRIKPFTKYVAFEYGIPFLKMLFDVEF